MADTLPSISALKEKPIVSIKEARKILGKSAKSLSDKEILDTVSALDKIAKLLANNIIPATINREESQKMERKEDNETR